MANQKNQERKKLDHFVKVKTADKTKAKQWLKEHGNEPAENIKMEDIPPYVFDYLNNVYKENSEVNTQLEEDAPEK